MELQEIERTITALKHDMSSEQPTEELNLQMPEEGEGALVYDSADTKILHDSDHEHRSSGVEECDLASETTADERSQSGGEDNGPYDDGDIPEEQIPTYAKIAESANTHPNDLRMVLTVKKIFILSRVRRRISLICIAFIYFPYNLEKTAARQDLRCFYTCGAAYGPQDSERGCSEYMDWHL